MLLKIVTLFNLFAVALSLYKPLLACSTAELKLAHFLIRYFPKIFGPNEDQELDKEATMAKFQQVTEEVNTYLREQDGPAHKPMDVAEVAMGFVRVANEAMCRPIRALTQVGLLNVFFFYSWCMLLCIQFTGFYVCM